MSIGQGRSGTATSFMRGLGPARAQMQGPAGLWTPRLPGPQQLASLVCLVFFPAGEGAPSEVRLSLWPSLRTIQDPLFRFFEREVKMGAKLLQDVRQDLADVVQVCEGKKKQTNYLRTLINELVKGAGGPVPAPPPRPSPPDRPGNSRQNFFSFCAGSLNIR